MGLRGEAADPRGRWPFRLEPRSRPGPPSAGPPGDDTLATDRRRFHAEQQIRRGVHADVVGQRTRAERGQPLEEHHRGRLAGHAHVGNEPLIDARAAPRVGRAARGRAGRDRRWSACPRSGRSADGAAQATAATCASGPERLANSEIDKRSACSEPPTPRPSAAAVPAEVVEIERRRRRKTGAR